jgi:ABC-2 type transport system ATP-binding protein
MNPVVMFRDVVRSYEAGKPVLNGVTFSMQPEEIVGLLGRNGAGKTTLMRIAMGMLFPHAGEVELFGLSPTKFPVEVKKRIGFVAADQELPAFWTVGELITLHRRLFVKWDVSLEKQLLDRFSLPTGSRIAKLSTGQKRQAALLCAVCHRPELLLLDEPAGGLDPVTRREFLETSIQLLNREGSSILFSSHQMSDVERLGGRVVLLDEGRVRLDRELDALREAHCVVMVPGSALSNPTLLAELPGCLRTRVVRDTVHAVFEGTPAQVQARIATTLGLRDAHVASVGLEDLFIEMVGGERLETAA